MRVLLIAPHPDDEVLGAGATLHRLAGEGHEVAVAIATRGWAPLFPESQVQQVRQEAAQACRHLGVAQLRFLDLPVTKLHLMPEHELNAAFTTLLEEVRPDWVFVPFPGDRHEDHRQIFDAAMVGLRPLPGGHRVGRVLAYETVSETHWSAPGVEPFFNPQYHVDVSDHLAFKLDAMRLYVSQLRPWPDARSIEAIEHLARWRGSVVGVAAAESFMILRDIWS